MALVNFALKCYPDKADYANTVFEATSKIFMKLNICRFFFLIWKNHFLVAYSEFLSDL